MAKKRELLIGLLVAAGVYAEPNARIFTEKASEAVIDKMIQALRNPHLLGSDVAGVITHPPKAGNV